MSSSTSSTNSTSTALATRFGIVGNFPGDAELLTELQWCGDVFSTASAGKPPLARLVALLGRLPLQGRHAVVRHYLAKSPQRDAILRDLFDYCFQQGDDEEGEVTGTSEASAADQKMEVVEEEEKAPEAAILRDLFDNSFQQADDEDEGGASAEAAQDTKMEVVENAEEEKAPEAMEEDKDDDDEDDEREEDEFVLIANPALSSSSTTAMDEATTDQPEATTSTTTTTAAVTTAVAKPLNGKRFHIFQVVLVLMAVSGPAGAEMSRKYLTTTASTKYQAKILVQCVECFSAQEFTNEELWEQYQISPSSVQDAMVKVCKRTKKRPEFLQKVYEQDKAQDTPRYPDLYYWCGSEYVAQHLESLIDTPQLNQFTFKQWGMHGQVYLDFYKLRMERAGPDKLKRGGWWKYFYGRLEYQSMNGKHIAALQQLLEVEYPCCYVLSHVDDKATKYLQELSAKGEDVEGFDENVVQRYHLPPQLVEKLPNKERFQWVLRYVQKDKKDWAKYDKVKHLVSRHKLPYKEIFEAATVQDFWSYQTGNYNKSKKNEFFVHFCQPDWCVQAPLSDQTVILQCWADLHLRCKPSNWTDAERSGKTKAWLWSNWYQSWSKFYEMTAIGRSHPSESVFPVLSKQCDSNYWNKSNNSLLEKRIEYAQFVLRLAVQALTEENVTKCLAASEVLKPIRQLVLQGMPANAVAALPTADDDDDKRKELMQPWIQQGETIIVEQILPILGRGLQFDPADGSTYVTETTLNLFYSVLTEIIQGWNSSEKVVVAVMSLVLDVHERSKKIKTSDGATFIVTAEAPEESPAAGDNNESSPRKKRKKFAYFVASRHQSARLKCETLAKELLKRHKQQQSDDDSMMLDDDDDARQAALQKLWGILKAADAKVTTRADPTQWLELCSQFCPKELLEQEKAALVQKSRAFIILTAKTSYRWKDLLAPIADKLNTLGWFEEVLEDVEGEGEEEKNIPTNVKHSLLVDHAGFANEHVQKNLKDDTFAASGEERAEGLVTWLRQAIATKDVTLISEAFTFAAGRVKNESGANRKTVFAWIERHCANDIVNQSLLAKEDLDIAVVDSLCSALLSIQQNDFSRLDSVGRLVCFPRLPASILSTIYSFDPNKPCLERRRRWVDCAIRLHWELEKANKGIEDLARYCWPIQYSQQLKSATWVSQEALDVLYPPSSPSSSVKLAKLGRRVDLASVVHKGFDPAKVFGPLQCVGMLVEALQAVWQDELPVPAFLTEGCFHKDDNEIATAQRERLAELFRLCGPAWEEVEFLASAFDNIFNNLESGNWIHDNNARLLLNDVMGIHGRPDDVPHGNSRQVRTVADSVRLSIACDKLFRMAVANTNTSGYGNHPRQDVDRWQNIYLERASRDWSGLDVDNRAKNFVYKHSEGCEPDGWRLVLDKTGRVQRECDMARELLEMSPSALFLGHVQKILFTRRQDVLAHQLKDLGNRAGPFFESKGVKEKLFDAMDDNTLLGSRSSVSSWYAKFALDKAASSRSDLKSRILGIHKFMGAPSTQHADVLAALQSELDDAVREALINRVFSLDSPWHILGHLLSKKGIEKNDQRITAALLGYVARHVHVDKVVRVVGLLLGKRRRRKLTLQLHKGAIRMLFDAGTPEAMELLRKEWDKKLPESVRALVIDKCLESVASGKTEGWEATVLSRVATDNSFEAEVKFALLAPQWSSCNVGSLNIEKADGVAIDEVLDLYRRKMPSPIYVSSSAVARTFFSILGELETSSEDATIKFLARVTKLSLSDVFASKPVDDQGSLDDLIQYLTSEGTVDHKSQAGMVFAAKMFGTGATLVLSAALGNEAALAADSASMKKIKERCVDIPSVVKLRSCVRYQLDKLLDLPVRESLRRTLILKSLESLMGAVQACSPRYEVYRMLVEDPFEKELSLLKKDANLVSQLPGGGGRL